MGKPTNPSPEVSAQIEKFFALPENVSPGLKAVAADIKKQNDKHKFLEEFIRKNGLPVWDKVVSNINIITEAGKSTSGANLAETNPANDTLLFFIPLRFTDSSIRTFIACIKFNNQYNYRVYRRHYMTSLAIPNDDIKKFRLSMFGVFGIFEKNINNKDSIFIGGQYQTVIENAEISFNNNASGRTNSSGTFIESSCSEGSWVWVCFGQQTRPNNSNQQNVTEVVVACLYVQVYVPPSTNCPGINNGGEPGSGGGANGGGNPPPNCQCPPGEWWCENGEYRCINGVLYTSQDYPGMNQGLPWGLVGNSQFVLGRFTCCFPKY